MRKYARFVVVAFVAVFASVAVHQQAKTPQFERFKVEGSRTDKIMRWLSGEAPAFVHTHFGPEDACAGASDNSGPSLFGNGVANGCATPLTMTNGYAIATVPCLQNYRVCQAWAQQGANATPVQGAGPLNCFVTSVATQVATQSAPTATVWQAQVVAPTALTSATVQVMGVY